MYVANHSQERLFANSVSGGKPAELSSIWIQSSRASRAWGIASLLGSTSRPRTTLSLSPPPYYSFSSSTQHVHAREMVRGWRLIIAELTIIIHLTLLGGTMMVKRVVEWKLGTGRSVRWWRNHRRWERRSQDDHLGWNMPSIVCFLGIRATIDKRFLLFYYSKNIQNNPQPLFIVAIPKLA